MIRSLANEQMDKVTLLPPLNEPDELDMMPCMGDFAPFLGKDDMEVGEEVEVEFIDKPFDTSKVLFST